MEANMERPSNWGNIVAECVLAVEEKGSVNHV
jgi:hypothetical protein